MLDLLRFLGTVFLILISGVGVFVLIWQVGKKNLLLAFIIACLLVGIAIIL